MTEESEQGVARRLGSYLSPRSRRRSAGELLAWAARHYRARTCVEYAGQAISFSQMNRRANRLAHNLERIGLERGQTIVLLMGNHPRFLEALFASQRLGLRCLPLPAVWGGRRLGEALNEAGADVVLLDHRTAPQVIALREHLGRADRRFVSTAEAPPDYVLPAGCLDFDALRGGGPAAGDERERVLDADAPGLLLPAPPHDATEARRFVSVPLGRFAPRGSAAIARRRYRGRDRIYCALPLDDPAVLRGILPHALWVGIPVIVAPGGEPGRVWAEVARANATVLHGSRALIERLLDGDPPAGARAHRLRRVYCAEVPREAAMRFEARFGVRVQPSDKPAWGSGTV